MMTSAQVVETSVNVILNSPSQHCIHPDDRTSLNYEITTTTIKMIIIIIMLLPAKIIINNTNNNTTNNKIIGISQTTVRN